MSERIDLGYVRANAQAVQAVYDAGSVLTAPPASLVAAWPHEVLALVEAVEAAHEVAGAPFGQIASRDFYRLREKLSQFDFSAAENGHTRAEPRGSSDT